MNLPDQLSKLGLHKTEIAIYLFLIQNGHSSVLNVSRETKISRTNCYYVLKQLLSKNLIEEKIIQNKKSFVPLDPRALVNYSEQIVVDAKKTLPDLYGIYSYNKNKPSIAFAETNEEQVALLGQILIAQHVKIVGSITTLAEIAPNFYNFFISELEKKGDAYIYNVNSKLPHVIIVWGTNCTFISKTEPYTFTTISNQTFLNTFEILFENVSHGTVR